MFIGLVLVAIGIIALLVQFDVLSGSIWGYAWPVILIIIGLSFLLGRCRKFSSWRHCCWSPEDKEKK
ncbi:MAG: DUF5668 domain-containing protein [Dehalococcoidales bacterium]|nr:DUF5668 domain-containing protein [Dehalococcoidales bacterium]